MKKKITANERAYLRQKLAQRDAAAAAAAAAVEDYARHLYDCYGLRPGLDSIQPDGTIVRGEEPKAVAPPPAEPAEE